jgi:hypothetical protein
MMISSTMSQKDEKEIVLRTTRYIGRGHPCTPISLATLTSLWTRPQFHGDATESTTLACHALNPQP